MDQTYTRRLPVGAAMQRNGGVHFRVFANSCKTVEVLIEGGPGAPTTCALRAEPNGYFSGFVAEASAGSLYRYRLNGGQSYPDPSSRFQPMGPHGPSQVVDPLGYKWTEKESQWRGCVIEDQVVYEMHIGTFTPEGTFAAAAKQLPELAALGITLVELMPITEFPGSFGWGYDGVDIFAPMHVYGAPDDLKAFVECAHSLGIGVILDVVYNHLGPDGNYLRQYSDCYFSTKHTTEWGEPFNFDGPNSLPVREFFIANAGYWINEYHFENPLSEKAESGQIYDNSPEHVLTAITRAVRERARTRETLVIAENEPQSTVLLRSLKSRGYGMDALWNDDFHHSARVALVGSNEAYFSDYLGSPQELISTVKYGFLFAL